jgi:hypothetical protein
VRGEDLRAAVIEAGENPEGRASRVEVCETLALAFTKVGEYLWMGGAIIGPDRIEGTSPFGFGSDATVGLGTVVQIAGELSNGIILLLEQGNRYAATALMAAIGEIGRFPSPRRLVGYLGLDPKVVQSGSEAARHGRISKRGPGYARHVLVEAALHARRSTGPMKAFGERVARRRGQNVATVAVARKLVVIAWNMLTRGEDYAFARPTLVAQKVRRAELAAGAPARRGGRGTRSKVSATERKRLEKELAAQAEVAYRRLVADWRPSGRHD